MIANYLRTTLRNLAGNRLYALINISGLSVGLALFVTAQLVSDYERNYDAFFPGAERIYAVYGIFKPDAGVGVRSNIGIQSRVGPLIRSDIPGVEQVARLHGQEYLARYEDHKFYQPIRFADPGFLKIFTFTFLAGDADSALEDPNGLIITASAAEKYFAGDKPIGKVIRFRNSHDLHVTAVIEDLPQNTHLTSNLINDQPLEMIATTTALEMLSDFKVEGDWYNMSTSEITYVLLAENSSVAAVNSGLAALYQEHAPERIREFVASYELRNVTQLNLFPWEASGLPVIASIEVLGALILLISLFNYTNLSTAQLIGRTREVGLRRVMGASRWQMFIQFLVESTTLTGLAFLLALLLLAIGLPHLNDATGKAFALDFLTQPQRLLMLFGLVIFVGCLAGAYPAWLVSRGHTINLLNGAMTLGRRAGLIRNSMLVAQFSIAFFMIICVGMIHLQNQVIQRSSRVFDRDHIITLARMNRDEISSRVDTLRLELERLPGVSSFALSSQVPFEQSQSMSNFGLNAGSEAGKFELYRISIDTGFLRTYDIPVLAGRNFSKEHTDDILLVDEEKNPVQDRANVIVNELALKKLGFTLDNAIGQGFYRFVMDGPVVEYRIIGVIPDANFMGFHNALKPLVFTNRPDNQRMASVRIKGTAIPDTLTAIDRVWDTHVTDYPIERDFLDDHFNEVYKVFRGINLALAGFAVMAIVLASIGLFGMAAYMAERRTREIGIRKVLGAGVTDIVRLLLLQFSRPVMIAILIASPAAWFAAGLYLDFFAERATLSPQLFIYSALAVLVLAWVTVISHAVRVARSSPVLALRYE